MEVDSIAFDDTLEIDARIDSSGVEDGMNDMHENVRRGMDAVNGTAESGMQSFSMIVQSAAHAAGEAIYKIGEKAKDSFVSMLKSGDEYNQAMNQLSMSTGAVGEELESLKDVAKDVFANNYGESYEDVANAVASVKKQLGDLPADQLQTITESAFALNDVFEYDVAESTRAAKAMVDNFGISGEYAMELIATGAQNGLDYSGELIDSISEYSVQFAKVGLDADDMFQIFQQGAENGAWNLDKVGDAVKEFSIRAIDGSTTTAEGFAAIGFNAEEMAYRFTQGGDIAKQAFQETVSALTSMEDPVARDAAGVALFGTMWEDLGVDAVASLGNIQGEAYATGDAMNTIKDVKFDNIDSAIEGLKRAVGSFTIDARSAFSSEIAGAIGTLVNAINSADGDISVIFDGIVNAGKQVFSAFSGVIGGWVENGKKIIDFLVSGIQNNLPIIQEKAGEILQFLVTGFLNGKKRLVETALPIVSGLIQGLSSSMDGIISQGSEIIRNLLDGMKNTLPELMNQGIIILQKMIEGITNALPDILPVAIAILTMLINGLTQGIVAILQFAPGILTALITGIIGVLPDLINCAVQILDFLVSAIATSLPLILGAAIDILMALITGIVENLTVIVNAALEIVNALVSAIMDNLPLIIAAAVGMLTALLEGIVDNLPMLINAAIEILMTLVNCLMDNLPLLIGAAIQIVAQLLGGILDNLPKLLDAGIRLITELVSGLIKAIPKIIAAIPEIISAIWDTLQETDWLSLGADILGGIADGLVQGLSAIWDTVTQVCDELWNGFKDFFGIHSPSRLMRDEIGRFLLPGVAVGVEDTTDETADEINGSLKNLSNQIEIPEITNPEQSEIEINPPKISVSDSESLEFENPETELPKLPEQTEINLKSPKISISDPEPIAFNSPDMELPEIPEQSEIDLKSPKINVSDPEPIVFNSPDMELPEIPEQSEIDLKTPKINVSEPEPITFSHPEMELSKVKINAQEPELNEFSAKNSETQMFTQQIEILRNFNPVNNVPDLDDQRITAEIQSQLDQLMVTLNADHFIARFEQILASFGSSAVPQYSTVYNQIQSTPERHENSQFELSKNQQISPRFHIYIGDTEIKDFVIEAIDQANAVSGGVSV